GSSTSRPSAAPDAASARRRRPSCRQRATALSARCRWKSAWIRFWWPPIARDSGSSPS
ncbi:hypothetical protein HMPREF0731_2804, partial [Pseudoroseomonas cervicalis ATCC 49957]